MRFEEFLRNRINEQLPIDKLKQDLSYFKNTFNYASKTDDLYNNLIDNIVFILQRKFGRFTIIYKDVSIMYSEMLLTLSPQIPQFLMIQKKQLLESLDTFADLNNWGEVLKDTIKRDLNLTSSGENKTNYIPLDGDNKDPYSTNDMSSNETEGENTNVNRNIANYLSFYENITWNIADLELEKILKPYYKMFKLYYGDTYAFEQSPSANDLEIRIEKLEQADLMFAEELDTTNHNVETNRTEIIRVEQKVDANTQSINDNSEAIVLLENNKADKSELANKVDISQLENYYTKNESDDKYALKSVVETNTQNITDLQNNKANKNDVFTKQEINDRFPNFTYLNNNYYDKSTSDNKYALKTEVFTRQHINDNFATFNWVNANYYNKTYLDANFLRQGDVPTLTNYYTKAESDNKFALKTSLTNYYTKTESDNKYALKTTLNNYYDITSSDLRYVQKAYSNTLSGTNTFTGQINLNNSNSYFNATILDSWNGKTIVNKEYVDNKKILRTWKFTVKDTLVWISGGALGGRYDIYGFKNWPNDFHPRNSSFWIEPYGFDNYSIIVSGNGSRIIFKRWDSDTNENKDNWVIIANYIPKTLQTTELVEVDNNEKQKQ